MRSIRFAALLAALVIVAAPLGAAEGGFTATLSKEQQAATGIASLTDDERVELNAIIASEVALARQGEIAGFGGTFSARRSDDERVAAGLGKLSAEELAELDRLVAALIAAGPVQRQVPKRVLVSEGAQRDRLEVHGEISYTVGWASGGRNFQGGSMTTTIFDRETGSSLSFSYGRYDGDLFGRCDWRYRDVPLATAIDRGRPFSRAPGSGRR
ncbi:MAG TPA: hypothetical protein VIK52_04545 [Opitutaceae bacterium]